ncbi:TPM domain-containing protein [Qipengyuania seohaensis]|uniref:TPM domain-containing protein n=1 Tax=Qipengyuania seohaensis TaxID=266951 RepID=UPI0018E26295|nr:TPM domain-containing protein [Qipengyuania seohaensis]
MALAAACSDGQAASQPNSSDTHRVSAPVDSAVPLAGRVTDAANILDEEFELALSERLDRFEEVTKHQMVVVTVSSLEGRDVTDFTRDLANGWGIGRKDHNDGVVVLVAPNERKTRIAVGSGLEAAIPDSACQAIIENRMLPRFRKGEFAEGIEAGVDALIDELGRHS